MARQKTTPPQDTQVTNNHGTHPLSTGIGATAGGIAGASLGLVMAGPIGEVAGAVLGIAVGGWGGNAIAIRIDSAEEHKFWHKHHLSTSHSMDGMDFDSVEPAYRIGYSRYFHHKGYEQSFEMAEPDLRREYEQTEAALPWDQVRSAAQAAWLRVHDMQQAGAELLKKRHYLSLNNPAPSHEDIKVRAWFIYENSGYPQGHDLDHWLQAERQQQEHAAIALQAWLIYEGQGCPQGHALDHWLQAERTQQLLSLAA